MYLFDPNFDSFEVIIVNNCRDDKEINKILELYSNVKIVTSPKNGGFGFGCNFGVIHANYDHILILNPDTYVLDNSISKLYEQLKSNIGFDVLAPVLLYPDGTNQSHFQPKDFPTLYNLITHYTFLDQLNIGLFNKYYRKNIEWRNIVEVKTLCGAVFLTTKIFFEKIGTFDENYFLYFEETDLFYRAFRHDLKIGIYAETKIYHCEGLNQREDYLSRKIEYYKSLRYFYKKHYTFISQMLLMPILFLGENLKMCVSLLLRPKNSWKYYLHCKAILSILNASKS